MNTEALITPGNQANSSQVVPVASSFVWDSQIVCTSDDPEWLIKRRQYLTASDIAIVMGRAPKWLAELVGTVDIIADKEGRGEPRRESQRMRLGKHMEPFARAEAKLQYGWDVIPYAALVRDDQCDYLAATLDGVLYTPWGLAVVEQKVVSAWPQTWERDGVPDHYQLQCQAQMAVTGTMHAVLLAYHLAPREDQHGLRAYYVPRDEDEIEHIRDTAHTFMTQYVRREVA